MQWSIINLPGGYVIRYIDAYVQPRSISRTQIVNWDGRMPVVSRYGINFYGNRLKAEFDNNNFSLKLFSAKYNDSGNYSAVVLLRKSSTEFKEAFNVTTVDVNGMFFSYCQ